MPGASPGQPRARRARALSLDDHMAKLLKHATRWIALLVSVVTLINKVIDIAHKLPW